MSSLLSTLIPESTSQADILVLGNLTKMPGSRKMNQGNHDLLGLLFLTVLSQDFIFCCFTFCPYP